MTPELAPKSILKTTIGDLAAAFYDEALREFGDEVLAEEISAQMVTAFLARRKSRS